MDQLICLGMLQAATRKQLQTSFCKVTFLVWLSQHYFQLTCPFRWWWHLYNKLFKAVIMPYTILANVASFHWLHTEACSCCRCFARGLKRTTLATRGIGKSSWSLVLHGYQIIWWRWGARHLWRPHNSHVSTDAGVCRVEGTLLPLFYSEV